MVGQGNELEGEVMEVGQQLSEAVTDVNELTLILEQAESVLTRIGQSPSQSMSISLHPLMKALTSEELLRHEDMDVKVAVASCINELIRITAPDAPYSNDLMKEIFTLIVRVLKDLGDICSHLYYKRITILEGLSSIQACVVMLDMDFDDLILEMFSDFLKAIRSDNYEKVFHCMESIMTLLIKESDDISLDLLRCLLDSIRKDSEDDISVARNLGEKVLQNCSKKLKPYLERFFESPDASYREYSEIVASICQEETDGSQQSELNLLDDYEKLEDKRMHFEEPTPAADTTPTSAGNNGSSSLRNSVSVRIKTEPNECISASLANVSHPRRRRPARQRLEPVKKGAEELTVKSPEMPNPEEELDEKIIGSRIEVWWPDDEKFYLGLVDAYYPVTKKHKIIYDDGDVEVLRLKEERWKYIENGQQKSISDPGSASEEPLRKRIKERSDSALKATPEGPLRRPGCIDSVGDNSSRGRRPRGRPTRSLGESDRDPSVSVKSSERHATDTRILFKMSGGLKGPETKIESAESSIRPESDACEAGNDSRHSLGVAGCEISMPSAGVSGSNMKNAEVLKPGSNSLENLKCVRKTGDDKDKHGNKKSRSEPPIRPPTNTDMVGFV